MFVSDPYVTSFLGSRKHREASFLPPPSLHNVQHSEIRRLSKNTLFCFTFLFVKYISYFTLFSKHIWIQVCVSITQAISTHSYLACFTSHIRKAHSGYIIARHEPSIIQQSTYRIYVYHSLLIAYGLVRVAGPLSRAIFISMHELETQQAYFMTFQTTSLIGFCV